MATAWGPLVGVRDFHPSQIRWCLMHVVNLGLLYVINGSIMKPVNGHYVLVLGKSWSWSVSLNLHFIFYCFLCSVYCMMFQHGCWLFFFWWKGPLVIHFFYLRNVLLRAGVFGNDAHLSMAVKLARAYEKFKSWQSSRGIRCSQPKFTEKMVPGNCF